MAEELKNSEQESVEALKEDEIESVNGGVAPLKLVRFCEQCKAYVPYYMNYCDKCGSKLL